ncbi:MAG: hypothetical protein HQM08_20510 [Candidatus Riflebacteria bacterium]|nr:hypothetical protein [Candidatus Riflebacteria bacterium]
MQDSKVWYLFVFFKGVALAFLGQPQMASGSTDSLVLFFKNCVRIARERKSRPLASKLAAYIAESQHRQPFSALLLQLPWNTKMNAKS